jgi:hypothetical protein
METLATLQVDDRIHLHLVAVDALATIPEARA